MDKSIWTPRYITKKLAGAVVAYGTSTIVKGVLSKNVEATRIDEKVGVAVASFALGSAVQQVAQNRVNELVDNFFDAIDKAKQSIGGIA